MNIKTRESELEESSEDYGIARLLKANLYNQLGRFVEAAAEAQIVLKLFPKPKNEPQLCPSALFELGNSFRLQGKSTQLNAIPYMLYLAKMLHIPTYI